MAYGKRYTLPFKTLEGVICRFDILERDYSGAILTMTGGGRSPVVHSWDAGSILEPVRGSKCVVQYLAKTKVIPAGGGMTILYEQVTSGWNYTVTFGGVATNGTLSISLAAVNGSNQVFNVSTTVGQSIQSIVDQMEALIQASTNFIAIPSTAGGGIGLEIFEATLSVFTTTTTTLPPASSTAITVPELPIETFLTTDETKYLGELYLNNVLQFTGYMVIDDFSAPYLTPPTMPTLTFTDGLALLDQVTLSDAGYSVTSGKVGVNKIIENILLLTNLDLSLRQYYNLFPEGELNRDDDPAIDAFSLQYLNIKTFLQNDDDFDSCKLALEKILKANYCVLMQQQGVWTIVRQPEYKRFSGNIPGGTNTKLPMVLTANWEAGFLGNGGTFTFIGGAAMISYFAIGTTFTIANANDSRFNTTYETNFITTPSGNLRISVYEQPTDPLENVTVTGEFTSTIIPTLSVAAPALVTKVVGKAGNLIPTERNQNKAYSRPTKTVTNTFNYRIPQLLTNSNLQRLGDLIGSSTDGDNTLTDYELSDWQVQNGATAYIRVITNTFTQKEIDRYMYMLKADEDASDLSPKGIVSVPIEVSQGDRFTLSMRFKAPTNSTDTTYFRVGYLLVTASGNKRLSFNVPADATNAKYIWINTTIDTPSNIRTSPDVYVIQKSTDISQFNEYEFPEYGDINEFRTPRFPADGILYIALFGFNNKASGITKRDTLFKDFQFEYFTYINDSIQIIGQENKSNHSIITKSENADEIFTDDSPKFNIAGTIFKKSGSTFIRTTDWIKQSGETETYNHGEVNAVDGLLLNSNWRTMFEGSFYGLCNPVDSFSIDGIEGLFVPYKLELDYRQNQCRASFQEVSKATDPTFDSLLYKFRYLYK